LLFAFERFRLRSVAPNERALGSGLAFFLPTLLFRQVRQSRIHPAIFRQTSIHSSQRLAKPRLTNRERQESHSTEELAIYAIASPLKPNDSGDQVANLQAALLFLLDRDALQSFDPPRNPRADELKALTEGLRNEQAGLRFGLATRQLLAYLQLQESLSAFLDGQVEETTAQRLNEWLVQLGVFYLAQAALVKLVVQLKLQSGLGDEGIVDEQTANALNTLLKKFGAFGFGTDFVVPGTVKDTHKRPPCGLVVIDFDRDLRRWQEQGRTETDPEGKFEIRYRYQSHREAEGVIQAL
jgi:hypothetical protein